MTTVAQWLAQEATGVELLEKQLLLTDFLGISKTNILLHPERQLSADEQAILAQPLQQLKQGKPYAYVTGQREFWSLAFEVNEHVLIPRPETELLVELILDQANPNDQILDMGTGSGAIAIAIKHSNPSLNLTACEKSTEALAVAQNNAKTHQVDITWHLSHWFSQLPACQYNFIVSNPPYIAANDPHLTQLQHEPSEALVANNNGLADLEDIIKQALDFLSRKGYLLLEHGYNQSQDVALMMEQYGYINIRQHKDLAGITRVTCGQKAT